MGSEAAPEWVTERLRNSPIRRERTRFYRDLKTFARKLGIQQSVVYYTECGCYSRIPTQIWNAFRSNGVNIRELEHEYHEWQKKCRREFGERFILPYLHLLHFDSAYSPLYCVRTSLGFSRSEFCKGICVQPATLYRVEGRRTKEFPIEVVQAFIHAGIPVEKVREWNDRTRRFAA